MFAGSELVLLAKGCPKHPAYRGKRPPRTDCPGCQAIYREARRFGIWDTEFERNRDTVAKGQY